MCHMAHSCGIFDICQSTILCVGIESLGLMETGVMPYTYLLVRIL